MNKVALTTIVMILAIALTPAVYLMITGDFPGAASFYGLEEDSAVVDGLFKMRDVFAR